MDDFITFKKFLTEISDMEVARQQASRYDKQTRREIARMNDRELIKKLKQDRQDKKQDTNPIVQKIVKLEAQLAVLRKQLAMQQKREGITNA